MLSSMPLISSENVVIGFTCVIVRRIVFENLEVADGRRSNVQVHAHERVAGTIYASFRARDLFRADTFVRTDETLGVRYHLDRRPNFLLLVCTKFQGVSIQKFCGHIPF